MAQRGEACSVCGVLSSKPVVDHCHVHGWVRGVVCRSCNAYMARIDLRIRPFLEVARIEQLIIHAGRCLECPPVFLEELGQDERARGERLGNPEEERDLAIFISQALRELRGAKGMTQDRVATLIGTKQPAIARLESGRSLPSPDLLLRIAQAFGKRLVIKFEGKEEE